DDGGEGPCNSGVIARRPIPDGPHGDMHMLVVRIASRVGAPLPSRPSGDGRGIGDLAVPYDVLHTRILAFMDRGSDCSGIAALRLVMGDVPGRDGAHFAIPGNRTVI